jgi:erythromycin esterase
MHLCSSRLLQPVPAGAMLFLCLLVPISAALVGCGQPTPAPKLNAFQSWIVQQAVPLKTVDPQGPLDDLLPLQQMVSNASIVGLGEAAHGSHEFFTMKHRLLEFLVEKMGFTMFAIEGSWSAGEQINTYVLTGQGDAAHVLQQFRFWIWNTQEVLAMLKWMRTYNANSHHLQKISFAGFDCQLIEPNTYQSVMQYLQTVDPKSAARVTSLYQGLRPDPAKDFNKYIESYFDLSQKTKQQYLLKAHKVYDLLKAHEVEYEGHSSPQAFVLVLQDARVIVQFAQVMSADPNDPQSLGQASEQRDAFMAENIAWLHEHAEGGSKLVLWAHDGHIQADMSGLGMHLRERYGSQYLPIGLSFYQGSFNAVGPDRNAPQAFSIQASDTDSYNYTLGSVKMPLYLLDLRRTANGTVSKWLDGPRGFLMIPAAYNDKYQSAYYTPVSLRKSFDVIIHMQKVTASQLIPL